MLLTEPTGGSEYYVEQESEWDVASGFSGIFYEYYMELTGFPTSFTDMMNGRFVIGNNPFAILYDGQKFILSDTFGCWDEEEYIGPVSKETISKLPKVK